MNSFNRGRVMKRTILAALVAAFGLTAGVKADDAAKIREANELARQPVSLPIVVGPDAVVKARPWEMRWQEVYERASNGREQMIVIGSDAKGATRCDDGPKVGDKFTFSDDTGVTREFIIESGKVYRCFLSDKGVPSIEPKDKPKPVRDAAKKVILGAVDFVTPPFGITTNPANCVGSS